jgi:soluble lytic murein transglycosylase-like protein
MRLRVFALAVLPLLVLIAAFAGAWPSIRWPGASWPQRALAIPVPAVKAAVVDPYLEEPLLGYASYRSALRAADFETIGRLAFADDSFLAYRAARTVAELETLDPAHRLDYYERVLALRIEDPLERAQRRLLMLDVARVAEAALRGDRALAAYREALPLATAVAGVQRLEADPYRRANIFLQARQHRLALEALDGRAAPSIEAPSYRAIGEHARALDAFRRWLAEVPGDVAAREGEAWSLFSLERWSEADAAFAALPDGRGLYGRGLVAGRTGRVDAGVAFLLATGTPAHAWLATSWLETRGRTSEAIDAYLRLARGGDPTYADDAAYRAFVLATRLGDEARAAQAAAAVPPGSFFALLLGTPLELPTRDELRVADEHPALARSRALAIVHDEEAAVGELLFALRASDDPATVVALAEALQHVYGEYRQSMRAATALIARGVEDVRVWRLAWPRAYPDAVERYAQRFDVEPALVWSIMRQESAFSPVALSTSNAMGLMQVIPSTWTWLAELQREGAGDPYDVAHNVRYGTYYLRWLLDYHGGDLELVVTSYNRGQGYIRRLFLSDTVDGVKDELYRHIDALETREYLQRVMVNLETYRQLYGDAPSLATTPP